MEFGPPLNETELPDNIRRSLAAYHKDGDEEENRESAPPEDEEVLIRCCWVVECYPPSCGSSLREGLESLGWRTALLGGGTDYIEWVEQIRRSSFQSGSLNLGVMHAEDSATSGYLTPTSANLPEGVKYIKGTVIQYLPGMTQLVLQFVFDDSRSGVVEEALRETYSTFVTRPTAKVYGFVRPFHQKQQAVLRARQALRERCWEWVTQNVPGAFAGRLLEGVFPTVEFMTLKKLLPFDESSTEAFRSYAEVLGLGRSFDAWRATGIPGLSLLLRSRDEFDFALGMLCGRISDLLSIERLKGYGSDRDQALLSWLEYLDHSIAVLSLRALLLAYDRRLACLRDEVAGTDVRATSAATLRDSHRAFVRLDGDVGPLCQDLVRLCERPGLFLANLYEFERIVKVGREEPHFFEQIRQFLLFAAPRVRDLARQVGGSVASATSLMSAESSERAARTSVRLTKWIVGLTVLLVVLTVALVAIATWPLWGGKTSLSKDMGISSGSRGSWQASRGRPSQETLDATDGQARWTDGQRVPNVKSATLPEANPDTTSPGNGHK